MVGSRTSLALILCLTATAAASDKATVTKLMSGLERPVAIAVRPDANGEDYQIFVADSRAGRIACLPRANAEAWKDVITAFELPPANGSNTPTAGPSGLFLLDRNRLVVTGNAASGRAYVRLYELADDHAVLSAEQYEQQIEPPASSDSEVPAIESFAGMTRTRANRYVADVVIFRVQGRSGRPGTWQAPVRAGTLGALSVFAPVLQSDDASRAGAIAVAPQGYVVVTESPADDSDAKVLRFLDPVDGSLVLETRVEMPPIVAIAYSPRTGSLYAAATGSSDEKRDGIYRIDDESRPGRPAAAGVQIGKLQRPTAMAFAPDGTLYVTALGELDDDDTVAGILVKVTGEL
jgi:hypothetical protein